MIVGFGVGWLAGSDYLHSYYVHQLANSPSGIREAVRDYPLVNALLATDSRSDLRVDENIDKKLDSYVVAAEATSSIEKISVFYRDLVYGEWVGVNENISYDPASMLKVAHLISILQLAEKDPNVLNLRLPYNFSPEGFNTLTPGKSYTIEQLLEAMIVKSDNGAKDALTSYLSSNQILDVFEEFGVMPQGSGNYVISARNYSLFFRVLYNATFLSREMSEKALELLSRTEFDDGLVAGVPPGTTVAHKFGQYDVIRNGAHAAIELHDCGIVYQPKGDDYFLCVMTRGKDYNVQAGIIKTISSIVYGARSETAN